MLKLRPPRGSTPAISVLLAAVVLLAVPHPAAAQWPPDTLENLKVLPQDIETRELIGIMAGFTRALGVRCQYCHVGEEEMPLAQFDFAADEKETKRKARVMIQMLQHFNNDHLGELETRSDPPVEVTCATCHRGVQRPRMLQDVLMEAYGEGGLESAVAEYKALRERYYGRYAYDFGSVPLDDVAGQVTQMGMLGDAVSLSELNLEMNPNSVFAQRQYAGRAIGHAMVEEGPEAGAALYHQLKSDLSPQAFPEFLLNSVGYRLMGAGHMEEAIVVFQLNVEAFPAASNVYDSLGEAYMNHGDTDLAIRNYEKSLELNPENTNAAAMLQRLRGEAGGED
jgi:tetratricopeptide (TPR) repeat protein